MLWCHYETVSAMTKDNAKGMRTTNSPECAFGQISPTFSSTYFIRLLLHHRRNKTAIAFWVMHTTPVMSQRLLGESCFNFFFTKLWWVPKINVSYHNEHVDLEQPEGTLNVSVFSVDPVDHIFVKFKSFLDTKHSFKSTFPAPTLTLRSSSERLGSLATQNSKQCGTYSV